MGRGSRDRMYDLHYRNPEPLVPRRRVFEIDERMTARGESLTPLDRAELPRILARLRDHQVESLAICFLHSYVNPLHEREAAEYFEKEAPDLFVSPSHRVCREWREYERTSTAVMNAYVSPILDRYLARLREELSERGYGKKIYLMQSNGGLIDTDEASTRGVLTLMSGPVGGSVGSLALSAQIRERNLICADMGGTSFDVSLVVDGKAAGTSERKLGGLPLLAPMVDIHTIGAGGGSVAWNDAGSLRVGPRSAGAIPGPACYGRGGTEPTVTDANLVLGRVDPDAFLGGAMRLSRGLAEAAVDGLAAAFGLSRSAMAEGIVDVVNSQMANAIRSVTVSKGIDPRGFALVAFGGAGPMHATFIATELGIDRIIVPRAAGAFSAWGMLTTDLRHDLSQTFIASLDTLRAEELERIFAELQESVRALLDTEGVAPSDMRFKRSLDMRYRGQEYFINVALPRRALLGGGAQTALRRPVRAHVRPQEPGGRSRDGEPSRRGNGNPGPEGDGDPGAARGGDRRGAKASATPDHLRRPGFRHALHREEPHSRRRGDRRPGDRGGDLGHYRRPTRLSSVSGSLRKSLHRAQEVLAVSAGIDPISTEVIRNAFNAIAEDMSAALGRSAFSPVIYESHDYGVALFNERVETLGQAPGHPFFIGGLDSGVKAVIEKYGIDRLQEGDVFTVNDSYITGGHLNDVDVVSVLTHRGDVVGFAAIRAHWLDVGMAEPGFPVNTTEIFQEGVRWGATKILSEGEWVQDVLDLLLLNSRAPRTLMGDLSAQVAAARMGERRYHELIRRFGLDVRPGMHPEDLRGDGEEVP